MLTYIDQVQFLNHLGLPAWLLAAIFVKAMVSKQTLSAVAHNSIIFILFISICWLPSISMDKLYESERQVPQSVTQKIQQQIPLLPAIFLYMVNNFANQYSADSAQHPNFSKMLQTTQFSYANSFRSAWQILQKFNQWCYFPAMLELRSVSETSNNGVTNNLDYHTYWHGANKLTSTAGLYRVCDSKQSIYCQDGALLVPLTITSAATDDSLSVSCASWWQSDLAIKLTQFAQDALITPIHQATVPTSVSKADEQSVLYHYLLLVGMQSFDNSFSGGQSWLDLLINNWFLDSGTYAYSLPLDKYSLHWINSYAEQLGLIQLSLSMTDNILLWGKTVLLFLLITAPLVNLIVRDFVFIIHFWGLIALLTIQPVFNQWLQQSIIDNDAIWEPANLPPLNWQLVNGVQVWQLQIPWLTQLSLGLVVLFALIYSALIRFTSPR